MASEEDAAISLASVIIDSSMQSAHTAAKRNGMQLSRFTDYSLRVLLYLTINDGRRSTLHEIANFYPISVEHLRKVVHELSRSGYINTYQGKNGGMDLAIEPEKIAIGKVIKHFEGHKSFIDCDRLSCKLAPVCTLKSVLEIGQEALYEKLNEYSLADLVESKPKMVKILANPI